jgi:hypothetical protein
MNRVAGVAIAAAVTGIAFSPLVVSPEPREFTNLDDLDNYLQPILQRPSWEGAKWAFTQGVTLGVYEPCAVLLKLAISSVQGLTGPSVLAVNFLLHVSNCMLMAWSLNYTGGMGSTTSSAIAFSAIVLVSVHPIMVEVGIFLFTIA